METNDSHIRESNVKMIQQEIAEEKNTFYKVAKFSSSPLLDGC